MIRMITLFSVLIFVCFSTNAICKYNYVPSISLDESTGSLHSIRINTFTGSFYPSYYGGIIISDKIGNLYYPWSEGIKYKIENKRTSDIETSIDYVIGFQDKIYFRYNVRYQESNGELVIYYTELPGTQQLDNLFFERGTAIHFTLDRCEDANEPVVIGVPYLTLLNILRVKNLFVSMYLDPDYTNASEIAPMRDRFSQTSVYYSQWANYHPLTNGKRHTLKEKIILKYSQTIDDVFPSNYNPVSRFRSESTERIVVDIWKPFNTAMETLKKIDSAGNQKLWVIIHDWQNAGYDNKLPETFPANPRYGGDAELLRISQFCHERGYLFSLHENYNDLYTIASIFDNNLISKSPGNDNLKGWYNEYTKMQAFQLKPSEFKNIINNFSSIITSKYTTNSAFIDVVTANIPSSKIDYDHRINNAGKFSETYKIFKESGSLFQQIHNGPVSAEGSHQYLYAGYYDDFAAQIHSANFPSSDSRGEGGFYHSLFVNFSFKEIRPKTLSHGLGYYERFFLKANYWQHMGRNLDSALIYAATELAYGHGAFISDLSYDILEQAAIEIKYIYPVQQLYSNSYPVSILYNDNGNLITASDYIQKYPLDFDEFTSINFMSQVYIKYNNGLEVFVNRHPKKLWNVTTIRTNKWISAHFIEGNKSNLFVGNTLTSEYTLPKNNGWLSIMR